MPRTEIPLIAFTGPEGSGKSTQARHMAESRGHQYISTGDMLRQAAATDQTELGNVCRRILDEHVYLPAQTLLEVINKRLQAEDVSQGVILDGGFRTVEETQHFGDMLEKTGRKFSVNVVYLRVPMWQCAQRLLGENGRRRPDDTTDAWLKRINEFSNGLGQRMSTIRRRWNLYIVDGNQSIDTVHQEISRRLTHITD